MFIADVVPGIRFPIIQAPMAGTSTPELAAAVSNAGGLGSLGIGAATVSDAREMIERTRELTDKPFNVNVFCHRSPSRDDQAESAWISHLAPLFEEVGESLPSEIEDLDSSFLDNDEMFEMFLETRPAVVSFHFGFPNPAKVEALKAAGITLFATATCPWEANAIEAAGVDAIVAQGIEAGGHRGIFDPTGNDERLPTSVLVRLLSKTCSLPIIAAGGIMDGAGIRAMLELGAVAAQMGTAFVLCPESSANDAYREALLSNRSASTRLTPAFTGRPARGLMNRFLVRAEADGSPQPPAYPLPTNLTRKLGAAAASRGIHDFTPMWAGQGAPLAREMPAGDLIDLLVSEMTD